MRDTFVRTLINIAKQNPNIELITGDLGFGVLKPFWELLPDQFINAGIAEQNMTSMAAGMALEGKTVFTYSIGNFPTLRCLEQIRNDCAYHDANVKIVCIGGGLAYGSLGMSHQATEDIAVLRALPNVAVFAPCDAVEAEAVTKAIAEYKGTCYLRLGRGGETVIHNRSIDEYIVGKAIQIKDGCKVALLSTGAISNEVISAIKILEQNGHTPAYYTFPTVKPLDTEILELIAQSFDLIVTCEEHNIIGGFGSAVSEYISELKRHPRILKIGINDEYCTHVGDQNYLRKCLNLDGISIAQKIMESLV